MYPKMDEKDLEILKEREEKLNQISGPRVGDWLIRKDGSYTRFTYDWGDSIQHGGEGGSFYLSKYGGCSYSGGLDPAIQKDKLEETSEKRLGHIWFFHHAWAQAYNGVHFEINFKVFKFKEG